MKSPPPNSGKKKKGAKRGDGFTLRLAAAVETAVAALFGPYAGWAQTALFVAELRAQKAALPVHLRTPAGGAAAAPSSAAKSTPKIKPSPAGDDKAAAAKKRPAKRKLEGDAAASKGQCAPRSFLPQTFADVIAPCLMPLALLHSVNAALSDAPRAASPRAALTQTSAP